MVIGVPTACILKCTFSSYIMPSNNNRPGRPAPAPVAASLQEKIHPIQLLYTVCWMATVLYVIAKVLPYWMPISIVGRQTSFISHGRAHQGQVTSSFYFYNEITGQVQWEDPGSIPYEDDAGMRYWTKPDGSKIYNDEGGQWRYQWVEQWSEELKRPYFYNQESRVSVWERPPDLAWRRIAVQGE